MSDMDLIAAGAGVVVSYLVFRNKGIDRILMFLYYLPYHREREFYELYDLVDDEATFTLHSSPELLNLETYADYLHLHKAGRKTAYKRFRYFYNELTELILTRTFPLWLLPAVLFWSYWYWYVLTDVACFVICVAYRSVVSRRTLGYYQRTIIGSVLHNYQKEQSQKAKSDQ